MTTAAPSPAFLAAFRERAGPAGTLTFAEFMAVALYDPTVGYYRQPRLRVGYGPGTDFFTATTSGPVFGELIAAAAVALLRGRDPRQHRFIELGAEPERGVMQEVNHPFAEVRTIRVGESFDLAGPCIVFSNELFDAQPVRRFRRREGAWRELGVALIGDALRETELPIPAPPAYLPAEAPDGYTLDAPEAAATLAEKIATAPWSGVFIACDYGKSWAELTTATPAGTVRAYSRHTQSNDLLNQPGQQDLTGHVCWDWLADALKRHRFEACELQTQEAFFIRHAEAYLAPAIAADATRFTKRKQSLVQLLHGAHLGQKFQVLHALR